MRVIVYPRSSFTSLTLIFVDIKFSIIVSDTLNQLYNEISRYFKYEISHSIMIDAINKVKLLEKENELLKLEVGTRQQDNVKLNDFNKHLWESNLKLQEKVRELQSELDSIKSK